MTKKKDLMLRKRKEVMGSCSSGTTPNKHGFIPKLLHILKNHGETLVLTKSGIQISIEEYEKISKTYFKSSIFDSFRRNLNIYGFKMDRKSTKESDEFYYYKHPKFNKDTLKPSEIQAVRPKYLYTKPSKLVRQNGGKVSTA